MSIKAVCSLIAVLVLMLIIYNILIKTWSKTTNSKKVISEIITKNQFSCDIPSAMCEVTRYVIFDTDMGLDDAWALLMLLTLGKLMKVKVLAITCNFGNTDLPFVTSNTFRILETMGVKVS